MKSSNYLVGVAFFTVLLLFDNAHGCSCLSDETPCQAFGSASAVFVGTVTGARTAPQSQPKTPEEIDWTPRTFKFSVDVAFLGLDGTEIEVATGSGGGDCGYNFVIGKRYLVYAYRSTKGDRLATGICSRTKPYEKAGEDIEFLGTLRSVSAGVTIYGEVKRLLTSDRNGNRVTFGPVAEASLVVEGQDERKEIRTDPQGRYRLSGLQPGKYKVTLLIPEELKVDRPEREVTITDRGCAAVDYSVADNGRISGKIYDAEAQPVPNVLVTLVDADEHDPERYFAGLERSDQEGRYTFSAVAPGRYLIAVNVNRYPQPDDPTNAYPPTYYPGVAQVSQASIINLGAGEKLIERDLRLQQRRAASVIRGIVTWTDGTPVGKAIILFGDVTHFESHPSSSVNADERGRFTIKAYQGQRFVMEARSNRPYVGPFPYEPMERAERIRLTVAKPNEVVKIVITKLR